MTKRRWPHRGLLFACLLIVGALLPQGAAAGSGKAHHCIFPDGTDYNEVWGVREPIVWFLCDEIPSGQYWRVGQAWGMNSTFESIPSGFVPAGTTPMADFLAKVVGVKYVVDPGTRKARTYRFTNVRRLLVGDGVVNGVTMGVLPPLSVGHHVVETYWTMRAMHCDGFPEPGCLPRGDTLDMTYEFRVTPGHH